MSDAELSLGGLYDVSRRDRPEARRGGGVCVLVDKRLSCAAVDISTDSEICAVDVFASNSTFRCISCYFPPCSESVADGNTRLTKFLSHLELFVEVPHTVICCGDFNIPGVNWSDLSTRVTSDPLATSREDLLVEFSAAYSLTQLVVEPTRGADTLDLLFVNDDDLVSEVSIVSSPVYSDHEAVSFSLSPYPEPSHVAADFLDFCNADFDAINTNLLLTSWDLMFLPCRDDVGLMYETLSAYISTLCNLHVPRVRRKNSSRGRLSSYISRLHRELSSIPAGFSPDRRERLHRNLERAVLRERKSIESEVARSSDPRAFHKYASSRMGGRSSLPSIKHSVGRVAHTDQEKADIFANFLSSVYVPDDTSDVPISPPPPRSFVPPMNEIVLDEVLVHKHLSAVGSKLNVTPDSLPPIFFTKAAVGLAAPLRLIFERSLSSKSVPTSWKRAFVTPVFKRKGSRSTASNYRPISITPVIGKILESIVAEHIISHCESHGLFDKQQFGFRSHRSTVLQLVGVLDNWCASINEGGCAIDVAYLDFKAAFDVVNHRFLLSKLRVFGLPDDLVCWKAPGMSRSA